MTPQQLDPFLVERRKQILAKFLRYKKSMYDKMMRIPESKPLEFIERLKGKTAVKKIQKQKNPLLQERICHVCEKKDSEIVWTIAEGCKECIKRIAELDGKVTIISKRNAVRVFFDTGLVEKVDCPLCNRKCHTLFSANMRLCQRCLRKVGRRIG